MVMKKQALRRYIFARLQENKRCKNENSLHGISFFQSVRNLKLGSIIHDQNIGQHFNYNDLSVQLCARHELKPKPKLTELKFGQEFTDHMLKIKYNRRLGGWQAPEIKPMENLSLHPAAKVFHYAIEIFEGMKAYRGVDDKIRLFRPELNMHRMNLTAQRASLPTFDSAEAIKCLSQLVLIDSEWVPKIDSASLYIRPTLIGIEPALGIASSYSALFYTILSPVSTYFDNIGTNGSKGVSLLADPKFVRAFPGSCGNFKMGSNYAPTIRVQKQATDLGFDQVLWLFGDDHQLTEVGSMNIFMYFINDLGERELITPPLNGLILPGITRDSILQLVADRKKCRVTEGNITMSQVKKLLQHGRLLELFGSGTACVVCPIERIHYESEDLAIPTMLQEEALFRWVLDTLTNIQYGKIVHPWAPVIS